jgi:hypothetical protein
MPSSSPSRLQTRNDRSADGCIQRYCVAVSEALVDAAEHICDLTGALYHAQLKRQFMNDHTPPSRLLYDRALLLHGPKRSEILTLDEVRQYGTDSFSDVDYLSIYGLKPAEWYARGIRLLGRTAVECTRDLLADRIGRDIAELTASLPKITSVTVFDPFAGSCNTLYWILRHVPSSEGLAFEFDPQVFEVTNRNISGLDRRIALRHGDFLANLASLDLPTGHALVVFVAPPWGGALDEVMGLDLRRTEPPITVIVDRIAKRYPDRRLLFATQVYEKIEPASLAELEGTFNWSQLNVYGFNEAGRNHGVLLGTKGWAPD